MVAAGRPHPGREPVRWRECQGSLRRQCGALLLAVGSTTERHVRAATRYAGSRFRLAFPQRGFPGARRCSRVLPGVHRRRDLHGRVGTFGRRRAANPRSTLRRDAAPAPRHRRTALYRGLQRRPQALPLRSWHLQGGLRARRTCPLGSRGLQAGRNRPPRRHARRGRGGGEGAVSRGEHPERPFILLAQQSLFDQTRAPEGKHTVWAYCHVPNGSTFDMSGRIEAQIERFAPGFRDLVLAKSVAGTADLERWNPNLVGGDINGGYMDLKQLFTRPMPKINPYSTPAGGLYICSSSTPPGGGVHGMCGYLAARVALRYLQ